jgi:multidrug efflux pump subunit AcrA (membrane-fusion protein)
MFAQEGTTRAAGAQPEPPEKSSILKYVLLAAAVVYVAASLYLIYGLKTRIVSLEQKQAMLEAAQTDLDSRLHATSSEFREKLSSEVGMTKQEMAKRAAELESEQKAAAAKLSAQQKQQGQQLAAVSGEVSGVKSDVGTARTDLTKTQTDLAATNAKLERVMGDAGVMSGLIARNQSELEALKRKGDRNYYDFTLHKGKKTPVSTVSLQLKKVDPKRSKFTLNVIADDRTIEKKDRTVNEPLQFYTGRDHLLYEIVVFTAEKNVITGYLSTPKNAPTPVSP